MYGKDFSERYRVDSSEEFIVTYTEHLVKILNNGGLEVWN